MLVYSAILFMLSYASQGSPKSRKSKKDRSPSPPTSKKGAKSRSPTPPSSRKGSRSGSKSPSASRKGGSRPGSKTSRPGSKSSRPGSKRAKSASMYSWILPVFKILTIVKIQFYMHNRKRKNRHWKTVPKVLATLYCEKFHLNGDIWLWIYAKLKVGTSVTNSTTEKHSSKALIWMLTLWDLTHWCKSHSHLVQRNKQHHRKAQLKSFHLNSHILFRLQKVRFNGFRLKLTQ